LLQRHLYNNINVGKAETYGFELRRLQRASSTVRMHGDYAYTIATTGEQQALLAATQAQGRADHELAGYQAAALSADGALCRNRWTDANRDFSNNRADRRLHRVQRGWSYDLGGGVSASLASITC